MNRKRKVRDILLRKFELERSYQPPALVRNPEWKYEHLLELVVAHRLIRQPDFFFVQIGAFDGVHLDPMIHLVQQLGLRGILVEPQVKAFERLRETYADHPSVRLENAAISTEDGTRDFYTTAGYASPQSSFNKEHLLKHNIPADRIVCRKVPCYTLKSLLRKHEAGHVDLVQIDAEGYDYEIIRTIDFDSLRPAIIRFEHTHLSSRDSQRCLGLLAAHGYRFISERRDIIALLDEPLSRAA